MPTIWASSLRNLLPLLPLPPVDPRTPVQIDTDIHDEIAFHLEQAARTLVEEENIPPAQAETRARKNFGDIKRIARTLKSIALQEARMLQRINTILMIIVVLAVIGVSVQVFTTQRYNTLALQAITTDLANIKLQQEVDARVGHIFIEGAVKNPGRYEFNFNDNTTLADILRQAGARSDCDVLYDGLTLNTANLMAPGADPILLRDGQTAHVFPYLSYTDYEGNPKRADRLPRDPVLAQLPGRWEQVTAQSVLIPDGLTFEITGSESFMRAGQLPTCFYPLPDEEFNLMLQFDAAHVVWRSKIHPSDLGRPLRYREQFNGRWALNDDLLLLNLLEATSTNGEPFYFKFVAGSTPPTPRFHASIPQTIDSEILPGDWRQIDEFGELILNGIEFEIISSGDVMNLGGGTYGVISHPGIIRPTNHPLQLSGQVEIEWETTFAIARFGMAGALTLTSFQNLAELQKSQRSFEWGWTDSERHPDGRWTIYEDHLLLNLGPELAPDPDHPLVFERVEE